MLVFKVFQKSELNENQIARELKFLLLNTIKLEPSRNKLKFDKPRGSNKVQGIEIKYTENKQEKAVLVNPTKNYNFFH